MSNQKPAARAIAPKRDPLTYADDDDRYASRRDAPAPQEHPFAYAIIEGPPGRWSAVCLEGVSARAITCLEPNGQPEPIGRAMRRITNAIEKRTIARKWGKP